MSWVSALCALYDDNAQRAGQVENWSRGGKEYPLVLLPVSHTTALAQIEITVNENGDFITARSLTKDESYTIIPTTEASSGRTSNPQAMPLFDKLIYVAGDYGTMVPKDKQKAQECYELYLKELGLWCESQYAHPKVCAVYRYILKNTVMQDLIAANVLQTDENGTLIDKAKIQQYPQLDAFVRFRVYTNNKNKISNETILFAEDESAIWLDISVQKSFIQYYETQKQAKELCYLSGKQINPTSNHPRKIRYDGDGAKLISANDDANFTYRGRFNTKDSKSGYNEALSIGYETSQKVHNALKWIIRRQGYNRDGICMVTWESNLNPVPAFYENPQQIISTFNSGESESTETEDILAEIAEENQEQLPVTDYQTAKQFNAALDGYDSKLSDNSQLFLLALDSAGPGRLALTYYKELASSDYLKNLRTWHESCKWRHLYFKDKKLCFYEGMANIRDIAAALYGTEQNKLLTLRKIGDKCPLLISAFERLRPCIIEGAAIPRDMVRAAVIKASNPLAYEAWYNYDRVLHIACSLVRRANWEKGVILEMELDKENRDRSYLYGRMLAVAESLERRTYERNEKRMTNAERYMQAFAQKPFRTWSIIWKNLQPYLQKLNPQSREYYKNLFGEITALFDANDRVANTALDGKYIIGYDCQRTALRTKNAANDNNNENNNENETEE